MNKEYLVTRMLEIFFVLSFAYVTYSSNIYILWGALFLLPMSLFMKNRNSFPILFLYIFVFLFGLYFILYGFLGGFRVFKTYVICLLFVLIDNYNLSFKGRALSYIHWFMVLSACVVYVDFCLYCLGLPTIMNFARTGVMPRPNGFMEDSNFYSYVMVCYVMYLKYTYNMKTKFFILSIFLSGSFSAIILLLILLLFWKKIPIKFGSGELKKWHLWRYWIIAGVLFIHLSYYSVVRYKNEIVSYIETMDMSPLLKMKTFSMFLRFDAQYNAMNQIEAENKQLLGLGPGEAKTLNDRNINLHNTYYQIYVEMGGVLIIVLLLLLVYVMLQIEDVRYLLLFGLVSIFGNMLEIFYFPILPFIFLLYKVGKNASRTVVSNSIYYNMH